MMSIALNNYKALKENNKTIVESNNNNLNIDNFKSTLLQKELKK